MHIFPKLTTKLPVRFSLGQSWFHIQLNHLSRLATYQSSMKEVGQQNTAMFLTKLETKLSHLFRSEAPCSEAFQTTCGFTCNVEQNGTPSSRTRRSGRSSRQVLPLNPRETILPP